MTNHRQRHQKTLRRGSSSTTQSSMRYRNLRLRAEAIVSIRTRLCLGGEEQKEVRLGTQVYVRWRKEEFSIQSSLLNESRGQTQSNLMFVFTEKAERQTHIITTPAPTNKARSSMFVGGMSRKVNRSAPSISSNVRKFSSGGSSSSSSSSQGRLMLETLKVGNKRDQTKFYSRVALWHLMNEIQIIGYEEEAQTNL